MADTTLTLWLNQQQKNLLQRALEAGAGADLQELVLRAIRETPLPTPAPSRQEVRPNV